MRRFATCSSKHSIGTIRSSIYRSGRSDNLNNSSVNSIGTRLYASKVAVPAPKRPHPFDSVVYPMNSQYVDSMLEKWRSSPDSVDASWKSVFEQLTSQKPDQALVDVFKRPRGHDVSVESEERPVSEKEVLDALRVSWLTRAYEVRGHLIANLDPLGMFSADLDFGIPRELELEYFGFSEEDLDRVFPFGISARLGGYHREAKRMPLRWIIQELRTIYCGTSGWEYMHIVDAKKTAWIRTQILNPTHQLSAQERKATYHDLALAEGFESFLATKYTTTKRFGLDGAEGLIPLLNRIIEEAAKKGVESFVIGMAHRGRLNVLANVCGKDVTKIFMEFEGKKHSKEDKENECGDVKYHLGISVNRYTRSGNPVNVELLPNPSHLETVDPVVCGTVRAKQHHEKDTGRSKVMAILIHGDAAYAGQGVCYESMGLGMLEYYNVGGTVHIVVNNQIGFTTNPKQSRSAPYCTELGKLIQAPIIHINADDLDETIRCAKIAVEWKTQYKQDVLIDLVCYRRYGHNETDEPSFTQPLMYRTIRKHPTALKLYSERLLKDNIMTKEEMDAEQKQIRDLFREKFEIAKGSVPTEHDWKEDQWKRHRNPLSALVLNSTAVAYKHLQEIGSKIATIPHGFEAHPTITRIFQERKKCYESGENVDWGAAEALAFATLILEGCQVRISGQDVERGTFSQRHALLVNMKDESVHVTLGTLHKDQGEFRVVNSSLSEYAVCGYELGYAMANDMSLIIWEAQFGDFANGAQIIFDQYLSSMESKWLKSVGMVINLPHGYDGMGPEHSSGRMERFLQSCDDSELPPSDYLAQCRMCTKPEELYRLNEEHVSKTNWQICFPSTPANYFHLLRRQMHRAFRKPLINFFSKAHLRAPNVSPLADFSERTSFCPVIDDPRFASSLFTSARKSKSEVRRVIFCTGQIYYTLATHFKKRHVEDIALVRVEQIAPFPWGYIEHILEQYPKSAELMWVQEEPQNMGAYTFVRQRFSQYLRTVESSQVSRSLRVISRPPSAATASGIKALHDAEIQSILENAAQ